jgi:hypothetical protein
VRKAAQLTPAEQARSDAYERSPTNIAELERAIQAEKRPEIRAELQTELAKQQRAAAQHGVEQAVQAEPDLVPAARVAQVVEALDATRLTPDSDLAGRDAHLSAVELAADQMGRGEQVQVAALIELPTTAEPPHGAFDANGEPVFRSYADLTPGERAAYDERQGIRPGRREEVEASLARSELQVLQSRIAAAEFGQKRLDAVSFSGEFKAAEVLRTATKDLELAEFRVRDAEQRAVAAKVIATADAAKKMRAARTPPEPKAPREPATPREPPRPNAGKATSAPPVNAKPGSAPAKESPDAPLAGSVERAAAEAEALNPDMLVQMEGMDAPMRVGDLLAQIKEEAANDVRYSKLLEVAADCELRT